MRITRHPVYMLFGLTALAGAVLGAMAVRTVALFRATARMRGVWLRRARPISLAGVRIPAFSLPSAFPIVAVIGLVRPKLVIAQSVLDACTPDELAAVLAHEQGHLVRHDNLRRALMAIAPDVLAWTRRARALADDWHVATEQSADEYAACLGANGRTLLAEALIRVARMAQTLPRVHDLPTSALYRGENIEARVRGLLAPPKPIPPRPRFIVRAAVAAASTVIASLALGAIQGLIEVAVNVAPVAAPDVSRVLERLPPVSGRPHRNHPPLVAGSRQRRPRAGPCDHRPPSRRDHRHPPRRRRWTRLRTSRR